MQTFIFRLSLVFLPFPKMLICSIFCVASVPATVTFYNVPVSAMLTWPWLVSCFAVSSQRRRLKRSSNCSSAATCCPLTALCSVWPVSSKLQIKYSYSRFFDMNHLYFTLIRHTEDSTGSSNRVLVVNWLDWNWIAFHGFTGPKYGIYVTFWAYITV